MIENFPGLPPQLPPEALPNPVYSGEAIESYEYISKPDWSSAPVPEPVETENTIFIKSPVNIFDYPVRIARPFIQGEIRDFPQAVLRGTRLPTQANVKQRWPDGSVKHALLSFIVPQVSNFLDEIDFVNQPGSLTSPLTTTQMLAPNYAFEALVEIYKAGFQSKVISARQMLEAGDYKIWAAGPIATTIVIGDHSQFRKYDTGFDELRSFRPLFHVTFWPSTGDYHVRVVMENSNSQALSDVLYGVRIFNGIEKTEIFRQDAVPHTAGTRWTRSWWDKVDPGPQVSINHNIKYLSSTKAIPNFDPGITIPASEISAVLSTASKWQFYLFAKGGWTPYMSTAGGRDDIGHFTGLQTLWLYSGDRRLFDLISKQADLAGAWPLCVREGALGKFYDKEGKVPALGLPISVYAHPNLWLFDWQNRANDGITIKGPRLEYSGTKIWGGWAPDNAHKPDPYSLLYLLTGDYFYLEQMQFWASADVVRSNPGYRSPPIRIRTDPVLPSGAIRDEMRGNAWACRSRVSTAYFSPDETPEKTYFSEMVEHMLAFWEGQYQIQGTPRTGSPLWLHGNKNYRYVHPLRFLNDGGAPSYGSAPWQHYMLIFQLGVAKEKGFDSGPLLDYSGEFLTKQFLEPQGYNFNNIASYWVRTRAPDGSMYQTWTESFPGNPAPPTSLPAQPQDGYAAYAYGASTMTRHLPGGEMAYGWLRGEFYEKLKAGFAKRPKWAVLPRVGLGNTGHTMADKSLSTDLA